MRGSLIVAFRVALHVRLTRLLSFVPHFNQLADKSNAIAKNVKPKLAPGDSNFVHLTTNHVHPASISMRVHALR